jgi:SAM-dependent methyltransferase
LHPVIESLLIREGLVPLRHDTPGAFVLNAAVLTALTLPLALLSWRCFERPLMALGRGARGRGRDTAGDRASPGDMRTFWNERAREDAFYFVDTRQAYRAPDPDRFWQAGELVDYLLDGLGVSLRGDEAVLEIGCGVGRITRELARRARSVIAVDVSDEMLARARELNPGLDHVQWLLGDGVSLDGVPGASVDACVSVVVLQHVPDPEITLGYVREVGRVLRPGGWAALQVSNDPSIHRPRDGLRQRVGALLGRAPKGQRHAAWLGSHVELPALHAAAGASGTTVERVWGEGTQYCQVLLRKPAAGPAT